MWQKTVKAPTSTPRTPTPHPLPPQPQPTTIIPTQQPNPSPPQSAQVPKDWKKYTNKKLGIALAYPIDWFLYDEAKWNEDAKTNNCNDALYPKDEAILSRRNIGMCVGSAGDDWPGDLIMVYKDIKCPNYYNLLSSDQYRHTIFNGFPAVKYVFTEKTPLPSKMATSIDIDFKNGCYGISFVQIDDKGHYDPIFDKILSRIRFLK